jgi:PAS domain S-box-containing protein
MTNETIRINNRLGEQLSAGVDLPLSINASYLQDEDTPVDQLDQTLRLLLVEDNPGDARLVEEYLRLSSVEAEIVHETRLADALKRIKIEAFSLILLDLSLPDSFDLNTLEEVLGVAPGIPVIVMTGTDDVELAKRALKLGAQDYLIKGTFDEVLLERAIQYAAERHRLRLQNRAYLRSLQESEERLKSLFNNVDIGMYRTRPDGEIVFANPALVEMLGFDSFQALADLNLEEDGFAFQEDRQEFKQKLEEHGQVVGLESVWVRADGSRIYVRESAKAIRDETGEVLFYEGTAEDITAQVEAQEQLRLQAAALNAAPGAVMITDPDGKITWVNPAFGDLTGYTLDEVVGKNPRFLKSGQQDEAFYERFWKTIKAGLPWQGEMVNKRKDGRLFHEEMIVAPLENDRGEITHFIAIKNDISARVRSAEALRQRLDEISVLEAVATAGIEATDEDELIERVTKLIGEILDADLYGLLILDQETKCLQIHPSFAGMSDEQRTIQLPLEEGLVGPVAAGGEPKRVSDVRTEQNFICMDPKIQSGLYAPLVSGADVIGVIAAESTRVDAFSQDDQRLLTTMAGQLATAIEKLRKQDAAYQQKLIAETLRDIAIALNSSLDLDEVLDKILVHISRLIPYETASLVVRENGELRVIRHHGHEKRGLVEWVDDLRIPFEKLDQMGQEYGKMVAEGQPVIIPDVGENETWVDIPELDWVRSYLGIPIVQDGNLIGLINLQHSEPNFYTQKPMESAKAFAHQVAIALSNASLLEKTEQQLRHLGALRTIDEVITASMDLSLTLDVLLQQVKTELDVDAANVLLFDPDLLELEQAASIGFQSKSQKRLRLGEGRAGQVALDRDTVVLPNVSNQEQILVQREFSTGEQVAAYAAVPLEAKGQLVGVLEVFRRKSFNPEQDWLNFLKTLAGQAAIAIESARLFEDLHRSNQELYLAYDNTLEGWAHALEMRDQETEGHSRRVTKLAMRLGRAMGMSDEQLAHLRRGTLLHDIGKMGIPDHILRKPGPLSEEEWDLMRQHPLHAYEMLKDIDYLRPALVIPRFHHEKWDGSGYPQGLKGEEIPLPARIFAIVDVWDALLSDRPYRDAWPREKAIAYLRDQRGKHFDPAVVKTFLRLLEED